MNPGRKVNTDDAKHYLSGILRLKHKLNTLIEIQNDNKEKIDDLNKKISIKLEIYKKMKEVAIEPKPSRYKTIKNYSTRIQVFFKKVFGKYSEKLTHVINLCQKIYDIYDDIETTISWKIQYISSGIKHFIRFIKRLSDWIPILYNDFDWSFESVIPILQFKLEKLEKCLKNGHYVGCEKDSIKVKELIEHIKRYRNIDKYTLNYDYIPELDTWGFEVCEVDKDNIPLLYSHTEKNPGRAKERMRVLLHQENLEQWHWDTLFDKIKHEGRRLFD